MAIGLIYRPMLELGVELGVDVDKVLAAVGLTRAQILSTDARLSPDHGRALGRALLERLPSNFDRCEFGLRAADRFVAGDADLLGYILSHSEHPLAALRALADLGRLIGDSADFQVHEAGGYVTARFTLAGGKAMLLEATDFAVAVVQRVLRERSRGAVRPSEVHVTRARPANARLFRSYFGAPVRFDAPAGVLVYERALLLQPFAHSDPRLVEILTQHACERVRAFPRDELRDRVRLAIQTSMHHGDCTIERVAQRCGVGERTLRRRLCEAGTSFRSLVDDVRKERALQLLEQETSVTRVAQQLGFSDATAFTRAFRRWTGAGPQQYRRARESA